MLCAGDSLVTITANTNGLCDRTQWKMVASESISCGHICVRVNKDKAYCLEASLRVVALYNVQELIDIARSSWSENLSRQR